VRLLAAEVADSLGEGVGSLREVALPSAVSPVGPVWEEAVLLQQVEVEALPLQVGLVRLLWEEAPLLLEEVLRREE
jgi:hypothetical protein